MRARFVRFPFSPRPPDQNYFLRGRSKTLTYYSCACVFTRELKPNYYGIERDVRVDIAYRLNSNSTFRKLNNRKRSVFDEKTIGIRLCPPSGRALQLSTSTAARPRKIKTRPNCRVYGNYIPIVNGRLPFYVRTNPSPPVRTDFLLVFLGPRFAFVIC